MKRPHRSICAFALFLLSGCTAFDATQPGSTPAKEQSGGPLSAPVGKNWQIIEEAPQLTDERGRLPFQTEQSLQPEGTTKPVTPGDKRTIETPAK
jgi:hypothetical protein